MVDAPYKKYVKYLQNDLLDKDFGTIEDIIRYFVNLKQDFITYQVHNDKYYEIIFDRQYETSIMVPILNNDDFSMLPLFYLDDDDIVLTPDDMIRLVLISRLKQFIEEKDTYRFKKHFLLRNDMSAIMNLRVIIQPFSTNNLRKIQSRIRVVKTYTIREGEKKYFDNLGDALWKINIPNYGQDIVKYSSIFNDPINVVSPEKGIYCSFAEYNKISGIGYDSDDKTITSIYPKKSNLPERLRQHYTSNYLEPLQSQVTPLQDEELKPEIKNALCVFLPVNSEHDKPFDKHPLGDHTLITGEVLITKDLAQTKYYVYRTIYIHTSNVIIADKGSVLNTGDVVAYTMEGIPYTTYDLKYDNAVIDKVSKSFNGYTVVLKIKSDLSTSRVISDIGIKGVTHPRRDLGTVNLPTEVFKDEDLELPVEMVIGPNSMKSGAQGIRLSWLALKQAFNHDHEHIQINPNLISEAEINALTSDLQKVQWWYKDKSYEVYIGFVPFGVTDMAKDCKTNKVKVMPETLKYMYLEHNDYLDKVASALSVKYVGQYNKWYFKELYQLKDGREPENEIVWDYEDKDFQYFLKVNFNNLLNSAQDWNNKDKSINPLLNPLNMGFVIKINTQYIRIPSAKLINYDKQIFENNIMYPKYLKPLIWLLISLLKPNVKVHNKRIRGYYTALDDTLYSKRSALANVAAPYVEGGNLKQLVSTYVPRGVTVVIDKQLEEMIRKFAKQFNKPIYEIGVRNPVLWRFQFGPKKVWTFSKFSQYVKRKLKMNINDIILPKYAQASVLRNSIDVLYDQSDTDGDLYPIAIPFDIEIQDNLNKYIDQNASIIYDHEKNWIEEYIKGESDNTKFYNVENSPFQYHTVDREWFAGAFANASIAKMKVGIATVNLWKFHSAVEYEYLLNEIDKETMLKLQFFYSRVVQDYVIRSIKHAGSSGSSGYDIYMLSNIDDHAIIGDLTSHFGATHNEAKLFVEIASKCNTVTPATILSRMSTGGNPGTISKYVKRYSDIDENIRNNMSYGRVIDHIKDNLLPSNKETNLSLTEAEVYECDKIL